MTANDFVSIDHILSDVTSTVNDMEFKKGFSKGWYVSRIQDAMQEFVQSKEPVEYGEDERGCDKYHQQKDDAL